MACKDLGRGAPSGSTSTAWRPVNLVSRCAGKSNDSKVCRWAGRTYVGGRRQPLLMSRTWWQLQSLVMYEGFKGEYLSRAHVLVSPALVVIIRDSLLLLCWVAGYRGGRGGGPEDFRMVWRSPLLSYHWLAAWEGSRAVY
jgi:hypothetical protein